MAITEFKLFLVIVVLWIVVQLGEIVGGQVVSYYATFLLRGLRGAMVLVWFYFTMTYAGYGAVVHSARVRAAVGIAAGYLIVATSVPPVASEFVFPMVTTHTEPFVRVSVSGVTPVRRTTQTVGYSLFVIGTTVLMYRFLTTGYTQRWRPVGFFIAALLVVSTDLVLEKQPPFLPGVDYAAIGVAGASVLLIVVFYRYDRFASVPVGRDYLFRTLDEPIFVVNSKRRIIDYNEAAKALCESGTEVGERINDALPGQRDIDNVLAVDDSERPTVQFDTGGESRHYEIAASEMTAVEGSGHVVIVLRDITKQRRQRAELEQQNERLDRFTSVVSHDLRSPLAVANNHVQLARQQHDSEHLDRAISAQQRMETLIDELLQLAREDATVAERRPISLANLSQQCWDTAETAEATLEVTEDRQLEANPVRLRQGVANLIRNAVEHGESDVTVTIGATEDGFYVADDGEGIPEEKREQVFEPGYTTARDGSGFGLAIVRRVSQAHGWELTVTESEAGGARFEFRNVAVDTDCAGTAVSAAD